MQLFNFWKKLPKEPLRFEGGEIVRLKKDYPEDDLKVGDCGLVWGVYHTNPPFYEASFFNSNGDSPDVSFMDDEVEESLEVIDVEQVSPVAAKEHFLRWLDEINS